LDQVKSVASDKPSLLSYWNIYLTLFELEEKIYLRSTKKTKPSERSFEHHLGTMRGIRTDVDKAYLTLYKDILAAYGCRDGARPVFTA
jgi:hypothetical protein